MKINEVCLKSTVASSSPGRAANLGSFISIDELDIPLSKHRAVSMDHAGAKKRLQSANRTGRQAALPQIGSALP
jgi:hypothetical protein